MTSKDIINELINHMSNFADTYYLTIISKGECEQILEDLERLEKLEDFLIEYREHINELIEKENDF